MKPLIVITRTRPDADALASKLDALGYDSLIEPMLDVSATHAPTTHDPLCVEGLVVTSAQALRHLNTLVREIAFRHKPLYAVGPKTAALAIEMGWQNVHDGGGDVRALGSFLNTRKEIGSSSRLLHVCGRDIAKDTKASLESVNCKIWDWVVYESDAVQALSPDFQNALRAGRIKGVLFYSARAAAAFASISRENVQTYDTKGMIFLCLSKAVLESLSSLENAGAYVAKTPDEDALLDVLKASVPL